MSSLLCAGLGACQPYDGYDEDWRLNDPDNTRRMAASCPNGGNTVPPPREFSSSIDGYAAYDGQDTCSGSEKPGTVAFKNLVLAAYPCTRSLGIVRGCGVGGRSEHKEGRAWDWGLNYPHPAAEAFLGWLLASDEFGKKHAMARRLGIMYMIWNRKIWKSYEAKKGWQSYGGSNPHTDHVHFSFSWVGANKETSYWRAPEAPPAPPANQLPLGSLDVADCTAVSGWAQDPTAPKTGITVELYVDERSANEGGVPHPVKADDHRADLCQALGYCNHAFRWILPAEYRDGAQHTIRAFALDTTTGTREELEGSPKQIVCAPEKGPIEQNPEEQLDDDPITIGEMGSGGRLYDEGDENTLEGYGCALGPAGLIPRARTAIPEAPAERARALFAATLEGTIPAVLLLLAFAVCLERRQRRKR